MRIAQIAPLAESVPPKLYGGTERVVSWLTEELVDLGCDVTLFASGDSETRAKLASVCPRALRLSRPPIDPIAGTASLLEAVAKRAKDFDIIHSHIDWIHLPLLRRLGTPCLTTLHGRLDLPFLANMTRGFSDAPFVSISDNQRTPLPALNWAAPLYHGLPADLLTPVSRPQGYLAFLGRITPEKGPDIAIRVARAAKMPLKIAAKIPRGETRYFQEEIKPLLDGNQVEFIGEVSDREKTNFLGNAAALLFPISWPEPFGLVMIEAMACGTPIIAWRCGSVPEVIEPGKTGFIVESEADAIKTIGQLHKLNRRSIRKRFEQRFTSRRMAQDYLQCYELVISKMAQSNLMIDGALLDTTRSQHNGVAVVESAYHLP